MTSLHILARWERIRPMLTSHPLHSAKSTISPYRLWMAMLYLADHPILTVPGLAPLMTVSENYANAMLSFMVRQGLAVVVNASPGTSTLREYTATALLFHVLGVKPAKKGES